MQTTTTSPMTSLKDMTTDALHDLMEMVLHAIRESEDPTELRKFRAVVARAILSRVD